MTKRYYHIIIGLLIVLNIFSWRFWWDQPSNNNREIKENNNIEHGLQDRGGRHEGGMGFFVDRLELSEEQKQKFELLRKQYFSTINEVNQKLEKKREQLSISAIEGDSVNDSVFLEISKLKVELERATFEHFRSMRRECNGEQKEKFDTIVSEMLRKFNKRMPGRMGSGRGGRHDRE